MSRADASTARPPLPPAGEPRAWSVRCGMRGLGLLLLALLVVAGGLLGQGTPPEAVLVELQIGRIAGRTVEAYRIGDAALVPLRAFTELAELRLTSFPDGSMETMVQPGNLPLVVDPASRTLRLGRERRALGPDELVVTPTDVYLGTAILARAFGLEWSVSWPDLQVTVLEPQGLPVARRLRRESLLRARLDGGTSAPAAALRLGLERPRVDGLVFDYSMITPMQGGLDGGAYSGVLGLDVLGGSLALGLQSQGGADQGLRSDVSWTGIWRESRWLSQLRVGDGYATGPRGRSLRGVSASNSPYVRPATIGSLPFGGQLGPGWTVEAYRGGRLIGFDSVNALGEFSFDVPVQYGENPVDFVAYGPFGEVQEFNRTYRMQGLGLRRGQFEYAASVGECRGPQCRATGNLDLRYGLDTRWTVGAGIDRFWRDSAGDLSHPYLTASGALGNAFSLEAEAVADAVLRGAFHVEPSVNLRLTAEAYRFARGVRDPILTPEGRETQYTLAAFLRPTEAFGGTWFEASLDRINTPSGAMTSGRLGASLQVAEIRLLPAVRFQRQAIGGPSASQTYFGVNAFILPRPALGKVLGSVSARTTLEFQRGVGAVSASAFVSRSITRGLRAETGATWFRGAGGASLSFLLAAELPSVRSYTTVSSGPAGAVGSQYTSGSAIYNRSRNGVDFSGTGALQRGGVAGRVFLDANGNGEFDGEDRPLAGVQVVVGQSWTLSDSSGAYRVWDLLPFEPVRVTVDSATIPSPLWVPAFGAALVEPSPNRYRQLDIPVVPGGVVEGRLTWGEPGASRPPAGVTLVLSHRETGERRELLTFSDGSFYALGVRNGPWELAVEAECLRILGASSEPIRFTMLATAEDGSVSDLTLRLHEAPALP